MTSGWCPRRLALDQAAYLSQKGKPPPLPRGSMDQRWLLHSSCQHLFGGKDDKWLVPTGCRYSFCCEVYERLFPPAVGTRSGALFSKMTNGWSPQAAGIGYGGRKTSSWSPRLFALVH